MTDDVLDSIFHGCALKAYLEVWAETRQFPPDSEATRIRAYQLYEEALAEKNRRKQPKDSGRSPLREAGQDCEAPEGGGLAPGSAIARRADCRVLTKAPKRATIKP
jgi:hypothetical protein